MTEPLISCPRCKAEIPLTESLAAPLINATRQQYEQQLLQKKDAAIARQELGIRERERQVTEAKRTLDAEIASQVATQLNSETFRRSPKKHERQNWLQLPSNWTAGCAQLAELRTRCSKPAAHEKLLRPLQETQADRQDNNGTRHGRRRRRAWQLTVDFYSGFEQRLN